MERVYGANKKYHKIKLKEFFRAFHSDLRRLELTYQAPEFRALLPVRDYLDPTEFANEIHLAIGEGGYDNIASALYDKLINMPQHI